MQIQQKEKQPYRDLLSKRADEVRDIVYHLLLSATKESWNNGLAAGRRQNFRPKAQPASDSN